MKLNIFKKTRKHVSNLDAKLSSSLLYRIGRKLLHVALVIVCAFFEPATNKTKNSHQFKQPNAYDNPYNKSKSDYNGSQKW